MSEISKVLAAIVCGFEHGGTTVLLDALRGHPALDSGFEGFLLSVDSPSEIRKHSLHCEMLQVGWELSDDALTRVLESSSHAEAYERLRELSPRIPNKEVRLIDKTPLYMADLDQVVQRAPQVPVICVVREPRAVISGWMKRMPESARTLEQVDHFCKRYNRGIQGLERALQQEKGNIYVLNYERFCSSPELMLGDVLDFLGLDFDPEYLNLQKTHPNTHGNIIDSRYIWEFKEELPREFWAHIRNHTSAPEVAWSPSFSIVMPVCDPKPEHLREAIESVKEQKYPLWELCIADDCSENPEVRKILEEASELANISVFYQKERLGVSENSNMALRKTAGDFTLFLDHDDFLDTEALDVLVKHIRVHQPDMIYTDEEELWQGERYRIPFYKPDFSPDLLLSANYFCHLVAVRWDLLEKVGELNPDYDGAQDYDFVLRATENAEKIYHVDKPLYYWRRHGDSMSSTDQSLAPITRKSLALVQAALDRRGIDAQALPGLSPHTIRVKRKIQGKPLVSLLIPFKDRPDLLSICLKSIFTKTSYSNFEVILIDNHSVQPETQKIIEEYAGLYPEKVKHLRMETPFNYGWINNAASFHANGEYLVFLNNDTEVRESAWIEAMLEQAQRDDVGAVGARLFYPDGTVQHAGVIIGFKGVAGHPFRGLPATHSGYLNKPLVIHNLSAVTAACMMMRKQVFVELGGFNSSDLRDDYTDVDLCLRIREQKLLVVYTPYASLTHHESASRPANTGKVLNRYRHYLFRRHPDIYRFGDPYYNANFSLDFDYIPRFAASLRRGRFWKEPRMQMLRGVHQENSE